MSKKEDAATTKELRSLIHECACLCEDHFCCTKDKTCEQWNSLTLKCRYFRDGVLPLNPALQSLMNERTMKEKTNARKICEDQDT